MTNPQPMVATTRAELAAAYSQVQARPRAVVMTMGALHSGHAELISAAREAVGVSGHVTVTIFVNPLQFGANEDLDKYPRTFAADQLLCAQRGADLIFAPTPEVIYPTGDPLVTVDPGPLGALLEGAARPGHFAGVLTVVAKLLSLTAPQLAFFGEKDYQQLTLIRQMVRDLDFPIRVVGVATVRAPDGLALSSRNKYLSEDARVAALAIPRAIAAAQASGAAGADAAAAIAAATSVLAEVPELTVEYVVLTDPAMGPAPTAGEARIIITAIVDGTRLLDNARVDLAGPQ